MGPTQPLGCGNKGFFTWPPQTHTLDGANGSQGTLPVSPVSPPRKSRFSPGSLIPTSKPKLKLGCEGSWHSPPPARNNPYTPSVGTAVGQIMQNRFCVSVYTPPPAPQLRQGEDPQSTEQHSQKTVAII